MQKYRLEDIRLVLAEPNIEVQRGLKSSLHSEGFRNVISSSSFAATCEAVEQNDVDLLIADTSVDWGDVYDVVHRIRHQEMGNNPFPVIIGLISDPSTENIGRAVNSGIDDILLKPITFGTLLDRITKLISERKPFIVTSDYIGPERRKEFRTDRTSAPSMQVPNPLNLLATGRVDHSKLQRLVNLTANQINEHKVESYAGQIVWLIDRLMPAFWYANINEETEEMLGRLVFVAEDLSRRLARTAYAHVGELSGTLVGVAQRVAANPTSADSKDISLLPNLSQAISAAFKADDKAEVARDISRSVQEAGRT
jgi:DNA-binding response OmpR family regulator